MTILIGSTTLCHGQRRFSGPDAGKATGPANLRIADEPGIAVREYVGADRVRPEHVRCDHGTVSFDVTRTFGSPADAIAWATGRRSDQFLGEESEGELKFDGVNPFGTGAVACVKRRQLSQVGCTVHVSYTIEG